MHRTTLIAVLLALSTLSIAAPAAKPLAKPAPFEGPVKRTVDETGLVSTQIEKAGDAKRSAEETYIITPIEKATKDKRTVDETEVVSSAIEKAGNAKRGDDANLITEKADSNKRTVDEEFIATPIEKAGAD